MTAPERHLNVAAPRPAEEEVEFRADRARLRGRLFLPGRPPRAAVVLHGATGVPQRFYRAFAGWMAEQGFAVLTYDYRDFGESAAGHPRTARATMTDWGLRDQPAAQAFLEARLPGVPLWVIGHSLGGFMLPFHDGAGRIARFIAVASGPVHVSDHPWRYRPVALAFWSPLVAGLTRLLRYVPGRALRLGPDLPAGVYRDWRRWCTSEGFYLGDVGRTLPMPDWGRLTADAKIVAVADDALIPPAVVWRLMQFYPAATKRQLTLRPADYGLTRIGHIDVFAKSSAAVWPALIA